MRGVKILVLGAAIVAGVGAVAFVQIELERARDGASTAMVAAPVVQETARVLVAARAVRRGETFREDALEWREWPKDLVVDGYVTADAEPRALEAMQSALARVEILPGDPIRRAQVIELDNPGVMSALLRSGMRAFAIAIAPETGAGGFVLPSDHVDVIFTYEREFEVCTREGIVETRSALEAVTLIRSVRVLAVDTEFNSTGDASVSMDRTTTLEVTPRQAEVLSLAEEAGRLTLALRGLSELVGPDGAARLEPMPEIVAEIDFAQELRPINVDDTDGHGGAAGGGAHLGGECETTSGPTVQIVRGGRRAAASVD